MCEVSENYVTGYQLIVSFDSPMTPYLEGIFHVKTKFLRSTNEALITSSFSPFMDNIISSSINTESTDL